MPLTYRGRGRAGVPGVGGGGALSVLYAGTMAESTLSGAHVLGETTLTLASADGFRDDVTFGIGVEPHDIVAVDAGANQVENRGARTARRLCRRHRLLRRADVRRG